jgi:uncharacterized protein
MFVLSCRAAPGDWRAAHQVIRAHPEGPSVIVGHVVRRLVRGVAGGMMRHWIISLLVIIMFTGAGYAMISQGLIPIPGLSPVAAAGSGASATSGEVREMVVEEIRSNNQQTQMLMILREKGGTRRLVMNVGPSEALAVASDMDPGQRQRGRATIEPPTSYDLMRTLVKELGGSVSRVVVTSFANDTFYAKVVMNTDTRLVEVESKPSDAVALALRARVPIFAATSVLDQVGRRPQQ